MADRLVDHSDRDFVGLVASADQPVPAGGSVAALTGASSAALLALVCDVIDRHTPGVLAGVRERTSALCERLLGFLDEDAAAYRAYLASRRGTVERQETGLRAVTVPLEIARACTALLDIVHQLDGDQGVRCAWT